MNSLLIFAAIFGSFSATVFAIKYGHHYFKDKEFRNETEYLEDCPFKYNPEDNNDYIVFSLDDQTTLWCEYTMGIRSDGVYGVDQIVVKGLNSPFASITLAIGQSIFPIIEKVDQFEAWADAKAFKTYWSKEFLSEWDDMKKKLDNLRFLETKSQEKDKKKK